MQAITHFPAPASHWSGLSGNTRAEMDGGHFCIGGCNLQRYVTLVAALINLPTFALVGAGLMEHS